MDNWYSCSPCIPVLLRKFMAVPISNKQKRCPAFKKLSEENKLYKGDTKPYKNANKSYI